MSVVKSRERVANEFVQKFNNKYPQYDAKRSYSLITGFFHKTSDVKIRLGLFNNFWIQFISNDYAITSTSFVDTVITKEQVKIAKLADKILKGSLRIRQ